MDSKTQEINIKEHKPRDYSFIKNNHYTNKIIKATSKDGQVRYFKTFYYCGKQLSINQGIVKYSCDKTNKCYGGKSKIDKIFWKFEYITDNDEINKINDKIEFKPKKIHNKNITLDS